MIRQFISRITGRAKKQQLPETFCVLPWVQTHVSTSGAMSPCCEFAGQQANLRDSTLTDAWNSRALKQLRKSFLKGEKPAACRKCFEREASGEISIRMQQNKRFHDHYHRIAQSASPLHAAPAFPIALDLRFSNLCNFKCRSCWHGASSKWFSDGQAIGVVAGSKAEISSFASADDLLTQMADGFDDLECLYFAGGEPLMLSEHYALLQKLVALGRTDVRLSYNTNMSVLSFRGQSILDLWKHFDAIFIEASVDATGALGANMRSGFKWPVFVKNIERIRTECPHIEIKFGVTVSIMNIMALPDLFDKLEQECGAALADVHAHSLQQTEFYRTQVLPQTLKEQAEAVLRSYLKKTAARADIDAAAYQKFEAQIIGLIDFMNAEDRSEDFDQFKDMTHRLDVLRQEDSSAVFAGLKEALMAPPDK